MRHPLMNLVDKTLFQKYGDPYIIKSEHLWVRTNALFTPPWLNPIPTHNFSNWIVHEYIIDNKAKLQKNYSKVKWISEMINGALQPPFS